MKHAILALLTQGPAYGLQIRNELERRLDRERPINVGQIYSTIERLMRDGLLRLDAHTSDGLPLYALTAQGAEVAEYWMHTPSEDQARPWETMVSQVLLVASLPGADPTTLIERYQQVWRVRRSEAFAGGTLGSRSRALLADAAITWLTEVEHSPSESIPVSQERPRKGRPRS